MPRKTSKPSQSTSPRRIRQPKPPRINWRFFDPTTVETNGGDVMISELLTYKKNLDLLLERKGEYVLIKGDEIVGYYPDLDAALDAGAERFGTEPALIKEIVEFEPIFTMGGVTF